MTVQVVEADLKATGNSDLAVVARGRVIERDVLHGLVRIGIHPARRINSTPVNCELRERLRRWALIRDWADGNCISLERIPENHPPSIDDDLGVIGGELAAAFGHAPPLQQTEIEHGTQVAQVIGADRSEPTHSRGQSVALDPLMNAERWCVARVPRRDSITESVSPTVLGNLPLTQSEAGVIRPTRFHK